jgi:hypothetical protein
MWSFVRLAVRFVQTVPLEDRQNAGGQEINSLLSFGQGGSFLNWNCTRIDSSKGTTRVVSDAFH